MRDYQDISGRYIDSVWRNQYGAIVVKGAMGTIQYYFASKRNAMKKYNQECRENNIPTLARIAEYNSYA